MDRKTMLKRWIGGVLAAFFLAFGTTWKKKFCLGDVILGTMGLPAWSQGTRGLHYSGIVSLIGVAVCFYLIAATTKDPRKTMAHLIVGTVVALSVLSKLI